MTDPLLLVLPQELEGERVRLRPFGPEDGEAYWQMVEESRHELGAWLSWIPLVASPADASVAVRRLQIRWMLREWLPFGIWDRASGRMLGTVGLENIQWGTPSCELGYWLRTSAQGRGYVTEAAAVVRDFAFDTLQMARIEIRCDARNQRSAAVAWRLGFVLEGTLQQERRDARGGLQDTLVFAATLAGGASGTVR